MPALKQTKVKVLDFQLPVRGIHLGIPWHEMPDGYSPDLNNVIPKDCLGRRRIGTRPGAVKYFGTQQFGGGAKDCQLMFQVTLQDTTAGTTADYILMVFEGRTYLQQPGDTAANAIDGGSAVWSTARRVVAAEFQNKIYMSDGLVNKVYDLSGGMAAWTASAGSFPIAGSQYPRYLVTWRGRMVLAHLDKGQPIIFFSKQGDPRNFDVGAVYDPTIAVDTSNNFRAGQMANTPTALIPVSEDLLLVSSSHTLFKFVGDPADGGGLYPISEQIGIHNQDAWCVVGTTLYFVGAGGFYRMIQGGEPELLSGEAFNVNFANLQANNIYIDVKYDKRRQLIWIFIAKELAPFSTSHCVYDVTGGGFFPITFPSNTSGENSSPSVGPLKVLSFDGSSGTNSARLMLMGGRDGYVRTFDDTIAHDDVTSGTAAISSYVVTKPLIPGDATRSVMMNGLYIVMGESDQFKCDWYLYAGKDAYAASITQFATGTFSSSGRQNPMGTRCNAAAFMLKFSSVLVDKRFDLERMSARFQDGGPLR